MGLESWVAAQAVGGVVGLSNMRLAFAIVLVLGGCGAAGPVAPARTRAPSAIAIAAPVGYTEQQASDICRIDPEACPRVDQMQRLSQRDVKRRGAESEVMLTGPLAAAPAVSRSSYGYSMEADANPGSAVPPAAIAVKPAAGPRAEQFDIEAKVQIDVEEIDRARTALISLTEAFGGQLMNEAVENGPSLRGASLSLRVPSPRVREFLARLRDLGRLRSSSLETREVSRMLNDAEVVQHNLEQALARYEQLLGKAANVAEATTLEAELQRVRGELNRVKSDLAWSRDRVERSTVYVTLALPSDHPVLEPTAKLYPGLRAALLLDVPPSSFSGHAAGFAGGGLSLQWSRAFDVELDLLKDLSRSSGGAVDFYLVTLGTALYSDYFGGGKRRTLNPYFGFRSGYARVTGQSLLPLGGVLGVELYKSERLRFSLDSRIYAMLGRKQGADVVLQPSLGLNIAY